MSIPSTPQPLDRLLQLSTDLDSALKKVHNEQNPISKVFIRSVQEKNAFEAKPSGFGKVVAFFDRLIQRFKNPEKYDIVKNLNDIHQLYNGVQKEQNLTPENVEQLNALSKNLSEMKKHVVKSLEAKWLKTSSVQARIKALDKINFLPIEATSIPVDVSDMTALFQKAREDIETLDEEGIKELRGELVKSLAALNVLRVDVEDDLSLNETDKKSEGDALRSAAKKAQSLIDLLDRVAKIDDSETEEVEHDESSFDYEEHEITVQSSGWDKAKLVGQAALQVFGSIALPLYHIYEGDYTMAAAVVMPPLINLGVSTGLTVASEKLLPENVKPYAREVIMPIAAISSVVLTAKGIDYVHGQMAYNIHTDRYQPPQNATNVTQSVSGETAAFAPPTLQPMSTFADKPFDNTTIVVPPSPEPLLPTLQPVSPLVDTLPLEPQMTPSQPMSTFADKPFENTTSVVQGTVVKQEQPAWVEPAAKTVSAFERARGERLWKWPWG